MPSRHVVDHIGLLQSTIGHQVGIKGFRHATPCNPMRAVGFSISNSWECWRAAARSKHVAELQQHCLVRNAVYHPGDLVWNATERKVKGMFLHVPSHASLPSSQQIGIDTHFGPILINSPYVRVGQ